MGMMEGPPVAGNDRTIEDPAMAEEMAHASDELRTQIEAEKKVNDGREFSRFGNKETAAHNVEEVARVSYEMRERAKNMSIQELQLEQAKLAGMREVIEEEMRNHGSSFA